MICIVFSVVVFIWFDIFYKRHVVVLYAYFTDDSQSHRESIQIKLGSLPQQEIIVEHE